MTEQATTEEVAAQTVPSDSDSSAAESPSVLLDTVTSSDTEEQEGQEQAQTTSEASDENAPVVPDVYEFRSPDGSNVDVDSLPVQALGKAARESNLTNEQAQGILDQVGPALTQHYADQHKQLMAQWAKETEAHPELGGSKLQESLTTAKQAFATFDPSGEALEVLTQWGLVNHPAIIGFASRVRSSIGDGRFVTGGAGEAPQQSTAKLHFPGSDLNE